MPEAKMREPQYEALIDHDSENGRPSFGLMTAHARAVDPKRLGFTAARYKFVAKMLSGRRTVVEIGCGDAFFTPTVCQEVGHVTAIDIDPVFIADVNARMDAHWPFRALVHDILAAPLPRAFDAAYALDVLEHIRPRHEARFLQHLVESLNDHGCAVIGMPSLESQIYASDISRAGHVNCKSGPDLKRTLERYFRNVFMFGMNDETLHTGFSSMCHYLLALCVGPIIRPIAKEVTTSEKEVA